MKRLGWLLRRHGAVLALWLGVLLIAASLALQGRVIRPLEQRVEALQAQRKAPRDALVERLEGELARQESANYQLASFYATFEGNKRLTDRLARMHALARGQGLEMKRADYRLDSQPQRRIDRYQMVLTLQGAYPKIRAFVAAVLREQPTLALEQIQFQRKDIAEGNVDALLTFNFYLAR